MWKARNIWLRSVALTAITLTCLIWALPNVWAASANVSRSYKAAGNIPAGNLVSLDSKHNGFVVPSNLNNVSQILGVVVNSQDSLLAVNAGTSNVQVATSGAANVLVSDVAGAIKTGDQITASPFDGVGMKATSGRIIGTAQADFNTKASGVTTQQVSDKSGKSQTIHVGFVPLSIEAGAASKGGNHPSILASFGESLTGHPVSSLRLLVSGIVVATAFAIMVALIHAAVYGTLVSVGRNPLGASAVYRALRTIIAMALLTLGLSGAAVYMLLA